MPTGVCILCLKTKPLSRSHLIPAAMYKYILDPSKKNDGPVAIERKITASTSRQVRDYLLCAECEDLFNKKGEHWVLGQVWNGKTFPLRDRLKLALHMYEIPIVTVFSGSSLGIDTDRLAYFALSVIWRAGAHTWSLAFGGRTRRLNLGGSEDSIRKYLLGETDFPNDVAVIVHVCTDYPSTGSFYTPSESRAETNPALKRFGFQALGLNFMVFVGTIPPTVRQFCCVRSSPKVIFQRDCSEKTEQTFAQVMATSREARGLSS
jgi:hypothetical protein